MPEKKRVSGTVDRVEGGIAVVVAKDPKDGETKEIYVDKKKLKKTDIKEGDKVTVLFPVMLEEPPTVELAPRKKAARKKK